MIKWTDEAARLLHVLELLDDLVVDVDVDHLASPHLLESDWHFHAVVEWLPSCALVRWIVDLQHV